VAPNVRLRTLHCFQADLLEFERHEKAHALESHIEQSRRDRIREDISHRLERACSHLATDDFRQLVEEMVDRQIKGERRVIRDFLLE
jgi:hypothetical protein